MAKDSLARGAKSASFSVPHNYPDTAEPKRGVPEDGGVDEGPAGGESKPLAVVDRRPQYGQDVADHYERLAQQPRPTCPSVKFAPLGSKCLLWRIPAETGTIVVAEIGQERPLECEVVAVSESGLNEYDTKALSLVKKGDKVLVRKHSGTEIKVEGHELTVVHVADILGRL